MSASNSTSVNPSAKSSFHVVATGAGAVGPRDCFFRIVFFASTVTVDERAPSSAVGPEEPEVVGRFRAAAAAGAARSPVRKSATASSHMSSSESFGSWLILRRVSVSMAS